MVCHLDHRLRGRYSTADAAFVGRVSAKLGLPFESGRADVRELARASKQSPETAGRAARYHFFAAVARRRRCRTLFLAHHADDLVETLLLNLFRGAGPAGLAAMPRCTTRTVGGVALTIARPWLGVWREEIDGYVATHRLKFREDASNSDLGPRRNRVRGSILPRIEAELGRDVRQNIWRTALLVADDEAWMNELAQGLLPADGQLRVADLRPRPVALQRRVLRSWLQSHAVGDLGFALIERVRELLEPNATVAKTNLPGDLHARRRAGRIFLERLPPPTRVKT